MTTACDVLQSKLDLEGRVRLFLRDLEKSVDEGLKLYPKTLPAFMKERLTIVRGLKAALDGEPGAPLTPDPERFWFLYGWDGHWHAYACGPTGNAIHDLGPPDGRATQAEAEADGRASGLRAWPPRRKQ